MQELCDQAQRFADSAGFWSSGQVVEKILFTMLFSQYKAIQNIENS